MLFVMWGGVVGGFVVLFSLKLVVDFLDEWNGGVLCVLW